jgi:putative SOS response-associated peptidase YedK
MCARFSLADPGRIPERYPGFRLPAAYPRRYNIAPTQDVLAARGDAGGEVAPLRWGLVPPWSRDLSVGQGLINARAETLAEKPAFREALRSRRCLIFADGFYEWTGAKRGRQPHRFTVDDAALFAFAGLFERWGPPERRVETCTIVTCAPNALLASIHDRMPVILDDTALDAWLHGDVADALSVLVPFDASRMRSTPVTPAMNRPAFDDPRCFETLDVPQQDELRF